MSDACTEDKKKKKQTQKKRKKTIQNKKDKKEAQKKGAPRQDGSLWLPSCSQVVCTPLVFSGFGNPLSEAISPTEYVLALHMKGFGVGLGAVMVQNWCCVQLVWCGVSGEML